MNCENFKNMRSNAKLKRFACRVVCLALAMLCALSAGCSGAKKKPASVSATPSPLPTAVPATPVPEPAVSLDQTVGYYFIDVNGTPTLYGGIAFTNTGSVPVVISQASFTFSAGGSELATQSFEPLVYKNDIVEPGATSNLALWVEYKGEKPSEAITVTATLTPEAAQGEPRTLRISNAYIADNYPGFSTISGTVENPASDLDCDLSIIYFSFYDESDKLLAVWHFTKDMAIPSEESRNFVMHMRSLPIPGLSAMTKRIATRAFGI